MASKGLSMCVSQLPGLSRSLFGFEGPEVQKRAWIWQGSIRLCWTRTILSAGESKVVRSEGEGDSQVGALRTIIRTGRVPGFRFGVKESKVNAVGAKSGGVATSKLQQDRSVQLKAAFGEEVQVAPEDSRSISKGTNIMEAEETSTNALTHEGDGCSGEDEDTRYCISKDNTYDSQGLSTSGDSSAFTNLKPVQWFPYDDIFKLNEETTLTSAEVLSMLTPFLVDGRRQRIEDVVAHRTYSVCIVVEGLLDLGNISAVFRTADALGFQSVHVIGDETNKKYKKNRKVSMGTEKWLDAEMWESTSDCISTLRKRGYRIAVTHIAPDTVSIHDIDWTIPTAVFFGNEHKGISGEAVAASDIRCSIPMAGMVDSFNVSVAAGILMHHAAHDRIARSGAHGDISPGDRHVLEAEFCLRHNRQTVQILDRLVEKKNSAKELGNAERRVCF